MVRDRSSPIQCLYDLEAYECARDRVSPVADFEWFAIDSAGHVAVFADAGTTWVPDRFFQGYERYLKLYCALANLPRKGHACFEAGNKDRDPLGIIAEWTSRGIFYYDWSSSQPNPYPNQPYRLICRPSSALMVSDLDPELQNELDSIRLRTASFGVDASLLIDRNT
jgi:hypothetical protein